MKSGQTRSDICICYRASSTETVAQGDKLLSNTEKLKSGNTETPKCCTLNADSDFSPFTFHLPPAKTVNPSTPQPINISTSP